FPGVLQARSALDGTLSTSPSCEGDLGDHRLLGRSFGGDRGLLDAGAPSDLRRGAGYVWGEGDSQREGVKGRNSAGITPMAIARANNLPVTGPWVMPHMPWPPATGRPGTRVGPTSGNPSAETGRGPTHSSLRLFRSTPSKEGAALRAIAETRARCKGASGEVNSMVPATRSPSFSGVQATLASGR